jgi:hypothetical protein
LVTTAIDVRQCLYAKMLLLFSCSTSAAGSDVPIATMGLPIVTVSSFDWGISKSIGIGENHAATFFLQWAPLLIVVPPLFV